MITTTLRLGDLLLGQRLITGEALTAALAAQMAHGGRLGTNLVELGALSIDHVAVALGEQHGVPAASHRAFEAVPSSALGAMPRDLCQQYAACPLLLEGETLHVAFLDPGQLSAIDEVGRIVGFTIRAYAAPELRLLYYLEKHYHIGRPARFLRAKGEPEEQETRRHPRSARERRGAAPRSEEPPHVTAPTRSLRPKLPGLAVSTESGTYELEVVEQRALDERAMDDRHTALWAESSSWSGWGPAKPLSGAPLETRFGRYEVLCRFASGGMANLYLARLRGPEPRRLIAIKRIHEHLSDQAGFVERFEDEARLAAHINHPNVVKVLEYGRIGRSQFIAMEYVDGESLATLLNAVPLQLPVCVRIIVDAAAGLHAAHELKSSDGQPLQVVHRDVSPHNLLIAYDGTVKVVDFGVAHARSNVHTSFVGMIAGKPAYMAPEQARGHDLDRRVDIFALGIILHEMTTRRRLFQGANQADTLVNVLSAPVPLPSRLVPGYPPALERIVMKALERNPDRRFATAEQMRVALDLYVAGAGGEVPTSALGQLMRSVFAERMAQKRQLLRTLVPGIA